MTEIFSRQPAEEKLIEEVVFSLCELSRSAALDFALAVGRVIVERLYAGDLTAFRDRGPKATSFRKLARHPQLPISPGVLFRSVAIYELCTRLGSTPWRSLSASHLRLVLSVPESEQENLLTRAHDERWPLRRLEQEVVAIRARSPAQAHKGGRRRRSALLGQLRELERALAAFEQLDLVREPSPESAQAALASMDRIRARLSELEPRVKAWNAGPPAERPQPGAEKMAKTLSR